MTSVFRGFEVQFRRGLPLVGYGAVPAIVTLLAAVVGLYVMAATLRGVLSCFGLAVSASLVGTAPVVTDELLGRLSDVRRTAGSCRRQRPSVSTTTVP
ncbi:hypothetical protein [Haloprofundus salilacus]|uniref:hypothetical protein n=1 Tax=Haloprofundus salilacus TaxID=2876190 RepID=UPI001CCD0E2C|nr:hypothetical protein [Haloprofundus salilacus]